MGIICVGLRKDLFPLCGNKLGMGWKKTECVTENNKRAEINRSRHYLCKIASEFIP
jgi:hypothetical protein